MTINVTSDGIELSDTVTYDDFMALGTTSITQNGCVATLQRNLVLVKGADLSGLAGLVINANGNQILPKVAVRNLTLPLDIDDSPLLEGITIQQFSQEHWRNIYLNLKNCRVTTHDGQGKVFGAAKTDGVVCTSAVGTGAAFFFHGAGGIQSDVKLYNMSRLGVSGINDSSSILSYWLKNIQYSSENRLQIGYNHAPCSVWEDLQVTGEQTKPRIDTFQASLKEHTIILLGTSVEAFYRNSNSLDRNNAHDNTKVRTGGIKYWNIVDGENGTINVYDSSGSNSPVKGTIDLAKNTLLADEEDITIPGSGDVAFVVSSGTNPSRNIFSNQEVVIRVFGKKVFTTLYSDISEVEATEGSSSAHIPILLEDQPFIDVPQNIIESYGTIQNAKQLVQALHVLAISQRNRGFGFDENIFAIDGSTIDLGSYNIISGPSVADLISITDDTITVRASNIAATSEISAIKTTGVASLDTTCSIIDSLRDSQVTIVGVNLAPAANHLYVSTDFGLTFTEMTTNVYVYLSNPQSTVKFKYEKGDGETNPIITTHDYELSNSGVENELDSFTNDIGPQIESQTTTLSNLIAELETKIDSAAKEASLSSIKTETDKIESVKTAVDSNLDGKISDIQGGKNTTKEIQDALTTLSDDEKQKFGKAADLTSTNTSIESVKTEVDSIKSTIETNLDKKISEVEGSKNTAAEIQNAITGLSDDEKEKFGTVADLTATNTKIDSIKSETAAIKSETDKIESVKTKIDTNLDGKISDVDGKNTTEEIQTAITTLSDAEKQKFAATADLSDTNTDIESIKTKVDENLDAKVSKTAKESTLSSVSAKVTDIFDSIFGSAIYDKINSVVKLFRGKDTSGTPFASFDMKDEDGNPSKLNRFFSRIKK